MPYLQITIPLGKSEAEARAILTKLRDTFPLRQSGGHFLRMTSYYIVFEQPEHMTLTMEQSLWLEQHEYEIEHRIFLNNHEKTLYLEFLPNRDKGCRNCNAPFDDPPSGYCSKCHGRDPYKTISFHLQFSPEEYAYISYVAHQIWDNVESIYLARKIRTFTSIIMRQTDEQRVNLLTTDKFGLYVQTFVEESKAQTSDQPNKSTTLGHETEPKQIEVILSRQEYQVVHTVAEQLGIDIPTIMRLALGIPEIQMAEASLSAAIGNIFSYEKGFFSTYFVEYVPQISSFAGTKQGEIIATPVANRPDISLYGYHLTSSSLYLSHRLPLLEHAIVPIMVGLSRTQAGQTHLAWEKEQLSKISVGGSIQTMPCLPEKIAHLEQAIEVSLPAAYIEFLAWMGHGAGDFMRHLDCFYPSLIHFQQIARDLLVKDNSPATLPDDAFIFFFQPEQSFAFFRLSEGDNPPVYAHRRDWRRNPFRGVYYHFSDFIAVQIALYDEYKRTGTFAPASFAEDPRKLFISTSAEVRAAVTQILARKNRQGDL